MAINTIIFDLGGVLLDWNPMYVYDDKYFDSVEKRDYFFSTVCTSEWNEEQDAGRPISDGTEVLVKQFPEWEKPIRDYYGRWTDMLRGDIPETVSLLRKLKESGRYKLYALTNWQAELFQIALVRHPFLYWFDGRVVSGVEKTRKPFPEFYQLLLNRYSVDPASALFIDDNLRNVAGAEAVGIKGIHFQSPKQLAAALKELSVTY
ncbi:MAG: HAD family phosphatase [Bacteroidota bacterium]|nr:HAD family phosphatase [Bacteroidota bacterium]